ncbi:thiamine pyrophosphokinase [Batrachochytrium salamandrivorans]|nr:thiamine pyrophosphokinase [Batrachochytrium salamandrivorans]
MMDHDFCNLRAVDKHKVLLVLNNSECVGREMLLEFWRACPTRVCADGAANWLFEENLQPDILCGDLDSVDSNVLEYFRNQTCEICLDPDQDTTDMEKCLGRISNLTLGRDSLHVYVLGAFGGRFDHEMANINAAFAFTPKFARLVLLSKGNVGEVLLGNFQHRLHFPVLGLTCGLLPVLGPCMVRETQGLKYNLAMQQLQFGGLISSSNQTINLCVHVQCVDSPVLFTFVEHPVNIN